MALPARFGLGYWQLLPGDRGAGSDLFVPPADSRRRLESVLWQDDHLTAHAGRERRRCEIDDAGLLGLELHRGGGAAGELYRLGYALDGDGVRGTLHADEVQHHVVALHDD